MDGLIINDGVRQFLMEQSGFSQKPVEDKTKETKPVTESKEEIVSEKESHFCPLCEAELSEDFDDEVLLERFSELYDNLTAISEAMENEDKESIDEEVEEEEGEEDEEGPDDEDEEEEDEDEDE